MGLAGFLALAASAVFFWRVPLPPAPSAAKLPPSAGLRLQPFQQPAHRDGLDLALPANGEVEYHVAMQAGATLVYSWSASRGTVSCRFADQNPVSAGKGRGAFIAQSSGWYRWRWKNQNGNSIMIHLQLNGYYQLASMPLAGMPYDR
jgi:hypothetical protein